MKTYHKILLVMLFTSLASLGYAQNKDSAKTLVDEGIQLHDAGKYAEAIEKYKAAMKADPTYLLAQYELAYSLTVDKRTKEAIPYLQALVATNKMAEAYDLLANIYDDEKDYEKSGAYYKQGLAAFPQHQRLHFNQALSFLRQEKNKEAEAAAIEALKLDPSHASSHRTYALACMYQTKKLCAIMGFCNFLLLEPNTERSAKVYGYMNDIFKNAATQNKLVINANPKTSTAMAAVELAINLSVIASKQIPAGRPQEQLTNQLSMVFKIAAEQSATLNDKDFFWKFYVDYFGKLAATDNMPAFARYITLSVYNDETVAWFKEHEKELKDFASWAESAKHEF